jgi:hypothetical protein
MYAAEDAHLLVTQMDEDLVYKLKCRSYLKVFFLELTVLSLRILQPDVNFVCMGS